MMTGPAASTRLGVHAAGAPTGWRTMLASSAAANVPRRVAPLLRPARRALHPVLARVSQPPPSECGSAESSDDERMLLFPKGARRAGGLAQQPGRHGPAPDDAAAGFSGRVFETQARGGETQLRHRGENLDPGTPAPLGSRDAASEHGHQSGQQLHHHHHHHLPTLPALPALPADGHCEEGVGVVDEHGHPEGSGQGWLARIPGLRSLSPRVRGLVLLNLLCLLVSTNWVVVKESGEAFDVFSFAFLRFGVAAAALTPWLAQALRMPKELRHAGMELGAWSAAAYLTQSLGLYFTDASRASFLSAFTVIVVPLLSGFAGRGVKPLVWASVVTAFIGVGLLEQGGTAFGLGDIWSLLSALFFGIQVFRTEVVSRRLPFKATLPLMSVTMATIAACAGVAALAAHHGDVAHMVTDALPGGAGVDWLALMLAVPWLPVLYTGLLSTDVALVCEFEALHDVSSVDAALIYTMEPVLGACFAWALLGERWGPTGWVGAALIVGSSLATQLFGSDEDDAEPPAAAAAAAGAAAVPGKSEAASAPQRK